MDKASRHGQMVECTKVLSIMESTKVKECTHGLMVKNMMALGVKENNTEKAYLPHQKEKLEEVSGKLVLELSG